MNPRIRPIQNHTVRHARKVAQGERQIKIGIRKVSGSNLRRIDREAPEPAPHPQEQPSIQAAPINETAAALVKKISSIHPHPSLTPFIVPGNIRLNNMPPSALTKNTIRHININPINNSTLRYNRHSAPFEHDNGKFDQTHNLQVTC